MAKKGRSSPNMLGGYNHYDAKGRKVGYSARRAFGGFTEYDNKGRKTGESRPGAFGGYNHYDAKGRKVGRSAPTMTGYKHYDTRGHSTGSSTRGGLGGYHHSDGCYIASCVYGSYDCPDVWVLRRYRDRCLRSNVPGRLFVKIYYAISPALVRWFGGRKTVKYVWRVLLDRIVRKLRAEVYIDSPYIDSPYIDSPYRDGR